MDSIRSAGYTLVLGPAVDVPILSYRVELPTTPSEGSHTFYVSVGELHLKRSYELVGADIAPTTEMLMAGVKPEQVLPPNERYMAPARAELKAPDLNRLLKKGDSWDPLIPNMFESGESLYAPVFADSSVGYVELESRILVFANDSMVLGLNNKEFLYELADNFDSSSDVVQVIGCSHGRTALQEGNKLLARGRAARVREELLLAGLGSDSVLHEACWSNKHYDEVMPRRGVVVKHLRERI